MCTGRCCRPPYTCSGQEEPDFLTPAQRAQHERAYRRGETNWSSPFEPWVVRSWARYLDESGAGKRADEFRQNFMEATRIANDPALSTGQKIRKIRRMKGKGKSS